MYTYPISSAPISSAFSVFSALSVRPVKPTAAKSTDATSDSKSITDTDAGKPTSASGDILDLSKAAKTGGVSEQQNVSDETAEVKSTKILYTDVCVCVCVCVCVHTHTQRREKMA